MKKLPLITCILAMCGFYVVAGSGMREYSQYPNNRAPLISKPYIELPLGSIKPRGWLLEMIERQRAGMTSQMDVLYPEVMGPRNGWLGGDGDQWERGPYWIDGLLPLAYIMEDEALIDKVKPWVEWALQSQRKDGFFGPAKDYEPEKGVQRTNSEDWWPRMVVLKFLKQYYSATEDPRVIDFMTRYFHYQLKTLPEKPLGHWTFWAEYRVCDNLQAVYWLYNITGDPKLLELGKLLHSQGYDFMDMFLGRDDLTRLGTIHCVNLAQGIKEPVIYYQQDHDRKYIDAVKKAFKDIRHYHGQPQGMYGGDEAMHGSDPTQGSELCSAVELMFSLEEMTQITGDLQFAEHLEKIAFNALPTQISDDFMTRQYFQQANQVKITEGVRNFDVNHHGTDIVFGLLTGYPCCTSNLHQGWPKFTQNLWYATPDGGLAALVYSPSYVEARVRGGVEIGVVEETSYPMDGNICFTVTIKDRKVKKAGFPLHLRIPSWCKQAELTVNGRPVQDVKPGGVAVIEREWQDGDVVEMRLPMHLSTQAWHENSVSIERGPLVYALAIEENWEKKRIEPGSVFGEEYWEVLPMSKWNYGLAKSNVDELDKYFEVEIDESKVYGNYPWNPQSAPIKIKAKGREVPNWHLYNDSAGPLPFSMLYNSPALECPEEEIILIPYGCTTLRISEFPVIRD